MPAGPTTFTFLDGDKVKQTALGGANGSGQIAGGVTLYDHNGNPLLVGQKTMAGSIPVVLPSDQSPIAITGTLTIDTALTATDFTIANAASLSAAVDLSGAGVLRILMPASWTAANVTFQVSQDNSTFYDLYDRSGNEVVVTAAASRAIIMVPSDFAGFRYLKIRSGTSGTPVAQGGSRTVTLITKAL